MHVWIHQVRILVLPKVSSASDIVDEFFATFLICFCMFLFASCSILPAPKQWGQEEFEQEKPRQVGPSSLFVHNYY